MKKRQRGAALLLALLVLLVGSLAGLLSHLDRKSSAYGRDRPTADALAVAKAALIGYAAGSAIDVSGTLVTARRPGDLPCPDLDGDGQGDSPCGNGAGTTGQPLRLGRLPWKDLGLPDLRDGSGERLWYAVSSNFKRSVRYNAPLNSDTPGTITLRDASGRIAFDAGAGTGVVAVVIAPGPALLRSGPAGGSPYWQDRGGAGANQASNYLDAGNGEDNAGFTDGSASDGFIAGPVVDGAGNVVVNDRLAWITAGELAPFLERRAVAEVAQCLREYADTSGGRYPWPAADSLGTASPVSYADSANRRFGRIPRVLYATHASAPDMNDTWTGDCNINPDSGWWLNWHEQVFYAIADNHKPAPTPPANRCGVAGYGGGNCLSVDGSADRQYVILAAGRRLAAGGQARSSNSQKNNPANYLEGANSTDDDIFASALQGPGGNDRVKGGP